MLRNLGYKFLCLKIQNLQVITKPQLVKVGALGIKKKVRILTHLLLYCVYLFVSGFVNRSP